MDFQTAVCPEMGEDSAASDDESKEKEDDEKPVKENFFRKFCSTTSLHGFKYIGDNTSSAQDRAGWAIAVGISLAACAWFVFTLYMRWMNSPVIVTFAETTTAVQEFPFPAVTFCSGNKVRKSEIDFQDETLSSKIGAEDLKDKAGYAALLCPAVAKSYPWDKTVDERAIQFLKQVGTPLDGMLSKCKWRNMDVDCKEIFISALTDEGLCHTFNAITANQLLSALVDRKQLSNHRNHTSSWTLEGGYKTSLEESYPLRSASSGSHEGLSFHYKQNTDDLSDTCSFPGFGFKILVHSPVDFPQVRKKYFRLAPQQDVIIGLLPSVMNTSVGLQKDLKPQQRQCFMASERDLHYFNVYTAGNCEVECLINASLISCNCSSFYMPRTPNTPICGAGSINCLDEVRGQLHIHGQLANCNCLPACSDIQYNTEISETSVIWAKSSNIPPETHAVGRVRIYFKEDRFATRIRSQLSGTTDLIAKCGGLLAVFLGFSFISLAEIVYFLIFGPLSALKPHVEGLFCDQI